MASNQKTSEDTREKVLHDVEKKTRRRDIRKGYIILYLGVLVLIIIGEYILYRVDGGFTPIELFKDTIGNLMGVLAAFLIFDIAHEKMSKDSYASEVSEQILDTLMYHPEALELYDNTQKKEFAIAFIDSVVEDADASEMIQSFLGTYMLTKKDFQERGEKIAAKECRIRTDFSYRFVLEESRKKAFDSLQAPVVDGIDPYFYVQEELNYHVKYLTSAGNNMKDDVLRIAFVFSKCELDKQLRGDFIFRESLDLEQQDIDFISSCPDKELESYITRMYRPHLTVDGEQGTVTEIRKIPAESTPGEKQASAGFEIGFSVKHDPQAMEHTVDIIFHMPKKWDSLLEIDLVEPTKGPSISVSYNEDEMNLDMYAFLNKGDESSYVNAAEGENGVFSIDLKEEWVFPVSGVIYTVKRK